MPDESAVTWDIIKRWILGQGLWDDDAQWQDEELWRDAPLWAVLATGDPEDGI